MPEAVQPEVINGLTPLENGLAGVHPRLYFTKEKVEELRGKITMEPWARFLARVIRLAEAGAVPHPAAAFLVTREPRYFGMARKWMLETIPNVEGPGWSPLYELALTYDWLYHDLDEQTRTQARDCLNQCGRKHYEALAKHEVYPAGTYVWNIMAHEFAGVAAAGMAIYGELPHVAPWLRFVMEKARLMTGALGPDGVSPEGICYGGFYTDCYIRIIELVRELLGWDFFRKNEHLQNVPQFYLYSMLPRQHLRNNSVHLCFGDGVRYNWHGPDYFLRKLAATYHDPIAQWVADTQESADTTQHNGAFLNLVWCDPSVPAESPAKSPTLRHFSDKGLVVMRSGWDGDESVFGFHCGPHAGHHALENYQQCVGGGHMASDAGSFLLFAHGDWLISDGGYAMKFTAYRNTALVNGVGQTGEGGEWFECSELRRERRGPRIVRVQAGEEWDYVVGDVTAAYEHAAGLRKFLRHVIYVKPDCWIIVDALSAAKASKVELFFHAYGEPFQTDRPFMAAGERAWVTGGERGKLRVTALLPTDVEGRAERQQIKGIGAHHDREMCILRLTNGNPARKMAFVTVLEAYASSSSPKINATMTEEEGHAFLVMNDGRRSMRFALPGGRNRWVRLRQGT